LGTLKISYDIDKENWHRNINQAGVTDKEKIERLFWSVQYEVTSAFEAGREFQKRYKEEDEDDE
jgi:hypothetical protein